MKLNHNSVSYGISTVDDLELIENPLLGDTVVVTDENRGGVFIYREDGTANDGTIFASSSTGKWHRQYDGSVNVKWFGAKGDGVTDDTIAIQNAIASDKSLNWSDNTYKITSEIAFTVIGELCWIANNAVISYEPMSHTYSCMTISLPSGHHQITGGLTVNVNQNANVGLKFIPITNGTDEPDLLLEDVHINEPYRILGFNDGDALLIVGSFRNVDIVRPIIKDCFMATDAGIAGTYGIFGITVTRNGSYSPRYTSISDVWIENVYSDNPTYTADQDGIRIFSRYGGSGTAGLNNANTFNINGGVIKNVRGRSVKTQTENGIINGLSLYRTKVAFGGNAGTLTQNADIETQTGGTTITDIQFQYEDFVPIRVIRCIQADETVRWASPSIVSNIRGVVSGSFAPETVVLFTAITTTTAIESQFICSDINVVSETDFKQIFNVSTLDGVSSVNISATFSNAVCPVSMYGFLFHDNATIKNISAINITNPKSPKVPLVNTENTLTINVNNISGFTGYDNKPITKATTPVTLSTQTNFFILARNSTTQVINMPDPLVTINRLLTFKNLGSQAVDSNNANVVPFGSTVAGTSIFGIGTSGTWLSMISDGINWIVIQKG